MNLRCSTPGDLLVAKGFLAFYAFETARDLLLGREPGVIRILTDADLLQLSRLFPDAVHGKNWGTHMRCGGDGASGDGESIVRFYVSEYPVERVVRIPGVIEHKRQLLLDAAPSALFNVNCFFYDIEEGIFRDPLDKYEMLKRGILETVERPEELSRRCPTLALKTARVFSETGFSLAEPLTAFLNSSGCVRDFVKTGDEVIEDFAAICLSGRAFEAFSLLDEWGVLRHLLPELTALKEVNQDKDHHPEGNGFTHTLRCLKFVKKPAVNLIMAILLHDTGKASTESSAKKMRTFPNHSNVSTGIAKKVLARFRFYADDEEEVLFLVQNHMILDAVKRLPKSILRRIFGSPYFPNLLELYRADLESGYHDVHNYYHAARMYKEFLRVDRLNQQGVYA
jgi:hypothetical protein